jgi:hypothetical protein
MRAMASIDKQTLELKREQERQLRLDYAAECRASGNEEQAKKWEAYAEQALLENATEEEIAAAEKLFKSNPDAERAFLEQRLLGINPDAFRALLEKRQAQSDGRLAHWNMRQKLEKEFGVTTKEQLDAWWESLGRSPQADDSWRAECKSKGQLNQDAPKHLVKYLVPEGALTLIPAPSYNCKTWFSLQCCDAVSKGEGIWGFDGPGEPVPVIYHVPEMNESLVRHYMEKIGVEDSDSFLVRAMEQGLWALDSPEMLASAKGRLVALDTAGYFNPGDDTNSYNQSLKFATLVYRLLNSGARGVMGLYHPPKRSKEDDRWTLENSVLGSAGYGGILRSCVRLCNLNPDLNDPDVHVYAEGLKNPGLKPFQLEGLPLRMKVPPSQSPYLKDLLASVKAGSPVRARARELFEEGLGVNGTAARLKEEGFKKGSSAGAMSALWNEWKREKQEEKEEGLPFGRARDF